MIQARKPSSMNSLGMGLLAVTLGLTFLDVARWQSPVGRLHWALPMLALAAFFLFWRRGISGLRGNVLARWPFLALLCFGLAGLASASLGPAPYPTSLRVTWTLATMALGLYVFSLQGRDEAPWFPKWLALLLVLQGLVVLLDFSLSRLGSSVHLGNIQDPGVHARPSAFRQEPGYLAAHTTLLVTAFVLARGMVPPLWRWAGVISGLLALVLSGSRMGQAATAFILLFLMGEWALASWRRGGWGPRLVVLALVASLGAVSGVGLKKGWVVKTLSSRGSFFERQEQALRGWYLFTRNPWFGVGAGGAASALNREYGNIFRARPQRIHAPDLNQAMDGGYLEPQRKSDERLGSHLGHYAYWFHHGDGAAGARNIMPSGLEGSPRVIEFTQGASPWQAVVVGLDYAGDLKGQRAVLQFKARRLDNSTPAIEVGNTGHDLVSPGVSSGGALAQFRFRTTGAWETFNLALSNLGEPGGWEQLHFRWQGAPGARVSIAQVQFVLGGTQVGFKPLTAEDVDFLTRVHRTMGRPQVLPPGKPVSLNLYTEVLSEWGGVGGFLFLLLLTSLLIGAWGWKSILPLGLLGLVYLSSETIARIDLWMALGIVGWWGFLAGAKDKSAGRTLVIKIGAMGDVLMATPFLRALRRAQPGVEIHWLVGRHSSPVLAENPHLDLSIVVDDGVFYRKKGLGLVALAWRLRRQRYDRVVMLHRSLFYFLFARFIAPVVTGYRRQVQPAGLWFGKDEWPDGKHHVRVFRDLVDALEPATLSTDPGDELDFPIQNESPKAAPGAKVVAINPGGGTNPGESTDVRQWPLEHWVELGRRILAEMPEVRLVLCGGPGDRDLAVDIEKAWGHPRVENRAGLDGLSAFRRFVAGVDVFVTGDTGGMHIAAAARVKVVALFGPTDPAEKAPLFPLAVVVWEPPRCAPCYRGKFPGCHEVPFVKCLRTLGVDRVMDAVRAALRS